MRSTTIDGQLARLIRLVLILLFLLFPLSSIAQIVFERTYGGQDHDWGYAVDRTLDGGYIITGSTSSFGAGESDVYLIKTDSLGDTLWTRVYGGDSLDRGQSVKQTSDGGYIVAGWTRSFGAGSRDIYLVKTDSQGDTLWTRTYGGSLDEFGYSVQQASEGGYIIAGETSSFGAGKSDVYLIKTDSVGDTLWTRTYGASEEDHAYSIQQTWDGGYVIVGSRRISPSQSLDVYIIKTDSLGSPIWTRTHGSIYMDEGWSVQQTWDGGYVIVGVTNEPPWVYNVYLIKTDSSGTPLWTRTYGGDDFDWGWSVQQTFSGGYIISGSTQSFSMGQPDVYLIETGPWGGVHWERIYGDPFYVDHGKSVLQISDGGYIVAGSTILSDTTGVDVYLLRTPGDGFQYHNCGVVVINAPQDRVFSDSTYRVRATVKNFGNVVESFDVVATINGYADTVQVLGLGSGSSLTTAFSDWHVPPTDSSYYTVTVCTYVWNDLDTTNDCREKSIFAYNPTGITEENRRLKIENSPVFQNTPNPFHQRTAIAYSLASPAHVTLTVYDITGSLVATLVDEDQKPEVHRVHWNATNNPSGVYFVTLQTGNQITSRKAILLR